ncbi:tRNA (adenine(22)-N(1))-methyltransferase [Calidifontibacillus oryziterrae]|uniref:tRNA (adenine(22)-N(1))-methyltransferase n=1 Tax=Calidifontibacillus oryziterrae TaxID=1191699 RepID=UPI00030A9F28|nr:tRNA (adenine(22)-N(1))-methyltransferase TrmK [Calidifontibacillus oryziterrae]
MNELLLSKRLLTVANEIPIGSKIADIGSDHAYLPCYAVLNGIVSSAIAGEVNEGPFQSAQKQVNKLNLQGYIDVRKGNGLEVINPEDVNVITIAGMGGQLICEILEEGKDKLTKVNRLILQPNVAASNVRKWLIENDWELINEQILEEDGKIYEVLTAERGIPDNPYRDVQKKAAAILLGPFLMKTNNAAFKKKWSLELSNWKKILKQLEQATVTEELVTKRKEIEENIRMVEEVFKQ